MAPSRARLLVGLGLVFATLAATFAADGGSDGGNARTEAHTVSGTISKVAWSEANVTIDAADGPVTLRIDRNTAVFLESRLGSARDLAVGTPVRASFGGDKRAVWVEVRSGADGGTGRDGGLAVTDGGARDAGKVAVEQPALPPPAGAPAVDGGAGDAGAPSSAGADGGAPTPGNVPAGPSPPEPNPGVTPPRPPPPGPTGPGPVPVGS